MTKYSVEELEPIIREACTSSSSMREAASKTSLHFNTFKRYAVMLGVYHTNQSGYGLNKKRPSIPLEDILKGNQPQYNVNTLKKRILQAGILPRKCSLCGRSSWIKAPIPLELDHIDGCSYNHVLSNLRLLCPNCHATTSTYRGRNKKSP